MEKKLVYIAHPVSRDIDNNLNKIKEIYRGVSLTHCDIIPFVPYFIALHSLDDNVIIERNIGFNQNKHFFEHNIIDEMWVYGISNGVNKEIEWCNEFNIKVVYK